MTCFHDFTAPLWTIFSGNLLLLICSLFYLVWWIVCFRPNASGVSAGTFYLAAAIITGMAAITLTAGGTAFLSRESRGLPVKYILLGTAVLFIAALFVTTVVFHRPVTSELMIIHIWAALELSAIAVLYGIGRFGTGRAVLLFVLVGIAAAAGLVCYVLYYRLEGTKSYLDGMAPLIIDSLVTAVFLGVLAVS